MIRDTRTRMLQATSRLLQWRGYHGTSLSDILEASSAPRGSLYFHFPGGKDQIVLEATRAAVMEDTRLLRQALDGPGDPARGVRDYLETAAVTLEESNYTLGCPVAPIILDAAGDVEQLAAVCRQAFEDWQAVLREAFVKAGMERARAEVEALMVESCIEGLFLMARAYRDTAPLLKLANELEALVRSALPARSG